MTSTLKTDCLCAHNEYRAKHHGTPSMAWSDDLAKEAQAWADKIAASGKLAHAPASERSGQGENIAASKGKPMTGRSATDQWYGEIKDFDFAKKKFNPKTGHFTQVIWKESIQLGAGIATASNGWNYCVARYSVAANLEGAFDRNIGDVCGKPQDMKDMDKLREELEKTHIQDSSAENAGESGSLASGSLASGSLKDESLNAHNEYRAKHGTPSMVWSDDLAKEAQAWADKIAAQGKFAHAPASERKGQGENIAACKGKTMNGRLATDNWYSEIKDFDFANKTFNHPTGHFTQVVWKGSTELGVGMATTSDGWDFCVARYLPPGNIRGQFDENVCDLE